MSKKILFTVHDFYPKAGGAGEVVYRLAKRFVRAHCEVTVATDKVLERDFRELEGIKIAEFQISGNKVKSYRGSSSEVKRYLDFVINSNFDVVINYAAQSWCSDLCFENIARMKSKKILIPCGYSHLFDPRYFFYFRWLPRVLAQYDHLVYLSESYQDFAYHRKHHLKNEVIIPNGADEEEFLIPPKIDVRKKYNIQTPYLALCVSNFFFLKGQDFVIRAFNQLGREDIALVLIGKHKNKLYFPFLKFLAKSNPRILFLEGAERGEVIDFFKAADFFLFGSRLECSPLVMFESFASKTLFITRDVGNVKDCGSYNVIVDSPKRMKEAIEKGILDKDFYQEKIEGAYQKYLSDHTYAVIFEKYRQLVELAVSAFDTPTSPKGSKPSFILPSPQSSVC